MVVLDKHNDVDQIIDIDSSSNCDGSDAPPSYETIIAASRNGQSSSASTSAHVVVDEKSSRRSTTTIAPSNSGSLQTVSTTAPRPGPSQPQAKQANSSWLSMLSFTGTSSRPSKQVRQTVLSLIRDFVLNPDSPDLLSSCADACRTYNLDLASLLQEPYIERHSPIYWAIVNKRQGIIESMLAQATPLSQETASEVRLACLATSNQELFQALRNQRGPFMNQKAPMSSNSGADAIVLGSMPADEVSLRELEGEGAFIADMKFYLWQKRMRVLGRVSVEFIARGRIWSLTFFSAPPMRNLTAVTWQVALCLLEHSPPTFIESRLVVDLPPQPSNSQSQPNDLISLSPPPGDSSNPTGRLPPSYPSSSPWSSSSSNSKYKYDHKARKNIEIHIKSNYIERLAYNSSCQFPSALHDAFSRGDAPWPPKVTTSSWMDHERYTNAIVVPLEEDAARGAELMYDNTPFVGADGTLHIRLEARLGKPQGKDCIIC